MTAPTAAPLETPRIYGSAKGFLRRAWKVTPETERPAPTKPARMARGKRRERMIACSISVPSPFTPRMDWRRMWIEWRSGTLTLPTAMERRMIRMRRIPRRVERKITFLAVTIFIRVSCHPLPSLSPQRGIRRMSKERIARYFRNRFLIEVRT